MGIGFNDFDERTNQSKRDFADLDYSDSESADEAERAEKEQYDLMAKFAPPKKDRSGNWNKNKGSGRRANKTKYVSSTKETTEKVHAPASSYTWE